MQCHVRVSFGRLQASQLAASEKTRTEQRSCELHLDPKTAAYLARKQAQGKSRRDAIRCLKRHLARRIWHILQPPIVPEPGRV